MSQHAPFADAAVSNDMTDRDRSYISYYTYGEALALALDLSLRSRTDGRVSLDDFMRRLWQNHGRPPAGEAGRVSRPYTMTDLRATLAEVASDGRFAEEFFDRYIEGRESPDFATALRPAGYLVQPYAAGRGWIGDVPVAATDNGLRVGRGRNGTALVPFGTPLYDAGIDFDDIIREIDGAPATLGVWNAISQRKPGASVRLTVVRRDGQTVPVTVAIAADPRVVVVPVEAAGRPPTAAERTFRESWLGTRVK
jgi:predicted metalloprotease with PDZ domain